jgi:hypothetical protein
MPVLDLFRPAWKHSEPANRADAVSALKDARELALIAREDPDANVRRTAVLHLDDQTTLQGNMNHEVYLRCAWRQLNECVMQ